MSARPPNSAPPTPPPSAGPPSVPADPRERLFDLLVMRATEGLAPDDLAEMYRLLDQHPDVNPDAFDHAAAGAMLAMVGDDDADVRLPESLRRRLVESCPIVNGATAAGGSMVVGADAIAGRIRPASAQRLGRSLGWAVAALLALAAGAGWWNQLGLGSGGGGAGGAGDFTRSPATLATMERFLRTTADAVSLPLAGAAAGFEAASGEVVWSDQQQAGYLRVSNLAPNNPAEAQYQLWIVDPQRDSKPVDGGVFDIAAGQNVVRIDAKLHVDRPAVFAITKEKPGGVVVSAGPLLVVAKR